jgi:hypothetical protein
MMLIPDSSRSWFRGKFKLALSTQSESRLLAGMARWPGGSSGQPVCQFARDLNLRVAAAGCSTALVQVVGHSCWAKQGMGRVRAWGPLPVTSSAGLPVPGTPAHCPGSGCGHRLRPPAAATEPAAAANAAGPGPWKLLLRGLLWSCRVLSSCFTEIHWRVG